MKVFISGRSALQYLLANGTLQRRVFGASHNTNLTPTRAKPQPHTVPSIKTIRQLGIPEGVLTNKLHVNVADAASRGKAAMLVYHVWNGPERGTYLHIDDVYCVQTPEACFAQLASELKFPHVVELGMLLCGTYVPENFPNISHKDLEPLTTPSKLKRYIRKLEGMKGLYNARTSLRYIRAGAASVQESRIAAFFALSTRYGGFGMPPVLNAEIPLVQEARGLGHAQTRRPDLLWPGTGVCLDYDSREWHDLMARGDSDEQRRNELAAVGLRGIVARPKDLRSVITLEALARQVALAMGTKLSSRAQNLPEKRFELFQDLFGKNRLEIDDL